jgi:voltage-gated potassium channel
MRKIKSKYDTFKQRAHIIIYGTSTKAGRYFDLTLLAIILLSVLLVMMETVAAFDFKYHNELVFL